jgi:hypothetical protein
MKLVKKQSAQSRGSNASDVSPETGAALSAPAPTPGDAEFARQMTLAQDVMRKDRVVLQALAK